MGLPVPAPAPEYRALTLFDDVPAGCILHPVADEANAPHLKPGEFAVVDMGDRAPVAGELFLIEWGNEDRALVETFRTKWDTPSGRGLWATRRLNRPRGREEFNRWAREDRPIGLVDGPYKPGMLERRLLGRVVGVFAPAFGEQGLPDARRSPPAPFTPR